MKPKIKILYIDDNPLDRALVKDSLERQHGGFTLTEAETQSEFEELIRSKKFDLILTDFNILGYEGLQVLDFVKTNYPKVPVILVTGTGSEEVAVEAMKRGTSDYVIKTPSHIKRLPIAIMAVLEKNKLKEEREKANKLVKITNERLNMALEASNAGIWDWNIVDDTQYWSNEFFILNNLKQSAKPGFDTLKQKIHPQDINILQEAISNALEEKKNLDCVYRVKTGEKEFRWIKLIGDTRIKDKKPVRMLGIALDVTASKNLLFDLIQEKNKAEESDRLKSAFLSNMSHEIRTPMNGILGFTRLLDNPDLTGEYQKKFIRIIHESGQRMLNTVNDIIEISEIESGNVQLKNTDINLADLLDSLVVFFTEEAQKKQLKIILKNNLLPYENLIISDNAKLTSVLTNLLKNAIKFTNEGEIEIIIDLNEKKYLKFQVKDTGIGIPPHRLKAVFNRFEQADIEDKYARQGSGLGLSIAKSYIDIMGGDIWVKSEPGKGSSFYFTIPYENSSIEENKEKRKMSNFKPDKLNLLIAEDDDVSAAHLSFILQDLTKNIEVVNNGRDAVNKMREKPDINMVLMDIRMPEVDGITATKQIREFNNDVVIIMQTAHAFKDHKEEAFKAGCDDYVVKPIEEDILLRKIEKNYRVKPVS